MQIPEGSWNEFGKVLNWIGCTSIFNYMKANEEPHSMPFDRGKLRTLHALEVVEVDAIQFVKYGKISVDENVQGSECFEEESSVYVHNLIGSTPFITISIKGFVFDPGIVFSKDERSARNGTELSYAHGNGSESLQLFHQLC